MIGACIGRPSIVALVNASVDAWRSGLAPSRVESGLAILLVLPVLALTILSDRRDALLIAAVGALAVLVQQVFVGLTEGSSASEYVTAGFLGLVLFVVALAMWPVANRLRESEALVRRQELDLENLAQLSQYIVQHLRESILVIDGQDRIRLINESAARMLGDEQAYPDALIGETSPRLLYLLESWRQASTTAASAHAPDSTFVAADGARVIRPFCAAGRRPSPYWCSSRTQPAGPRKVQQSGSAPGA